VILSEIGDYRDFQTSEQLAAYFGIVPTVYQSADKLNTGSITKCGSPHLRRMLIEAAHAIVRSKTNSRLKRFFARIKARRGTKIAIVALARKVLCILHHLLINREEYREDGVGKSSRLKINYDTAERAMNLDEMIQILINAGYTVEKLIREENKYRSRG